MKIQATTLDAYNLLHQGCLALSQVEANGIRIDEKYLEKAIIDTKVKIRRMSDELTSDKIYKVWKKRFGLKMNVDSGDQLGKILFGEMGYKCPSLTSSGKPKTDISVLESMDIDFVKKLLQIKKLKKAVGTYLKGIQKETCNGFLHPVFNLHLVETFRSCIAKGTLIEVVRDVSKYPKGIPIENIKPEDFVYCYDNNKNITIRKVLWAGKTGTKEVIRLHWSARGKKGHLDLTPEHKVRLVNGQYEQAQNLIGNKRPDWKNKHAPKIQVLALGRTGDRIYQTGKKEILDHRLVYECLIDKLPKNKVIHHKDGNHMNNTPSNLRAMSLSEHSKGHENFSEEAKKLGIIARMENHKKFGDRWPSGKDNYNYLDFTKFSFLRELAKCKGRITKSKHDFSVMKRKADLLGIDLKSVKDRYSPNGMYISLGKLKKASEFGRTKLKKSLGIGIYKLSSLLEERGLPIDRIWANQTGRFIPHNHAITKVEWIKEVVDVYDIEVEEFHNFIANEICVHNSSDSPNFQNQPVRNPEMAKLIRTCFIPRENGHIIEADFGGIEVKAATFYHKDPVMMDYLNDATKDMHRDMAQQCYMLSDKEMRPLQGDKIDAKRIKNIRYCGKNKFVFPQFYGDWFMNCAPSLWAAIDQMKLQTRDGLSLKEHLKKKGITQLGVIDPKSRPSPGTFVNHIKEVEFDFWNNRFAKYKEWKDKWWEKYQRTGQFTTLTGFVISGLYKRNEVINYPVQGVAFHCLLWSLIRLQKQLRKYKMKSLIVGQIHDSIVADVCKDEVKDYLTMVKQIMTEDIKKHWTWINTPLEVEAEMSPLNRSWYEKAKVEM